MMKPLPLLRTASVLALLLALPAAAQEGAGAPAAEGTQEAQPAEGATPGAVQEAEGAAQEETVILPEGETTEAQATDAEAPEAADAVPGGEVDATTVIASVNGTDITLGELLLAVQQLPAQYQQLPPDVLLGGVVDQLVQQELLAQTVTEEPPILPLALANQRRSLLANQAIGDFLATAVTEEALQAAYEERFGSAEPATEWNASHILVATEEEAQAVRERLDAGEDFATVAQEVSTDTGSGAQGGELGWFGPGTMVPEFEQGVAGLEPGEVSEPIRSQFGFHVIRLNETRPQEAPPLDQVRGELEAELQGQAIEARLAELEAGAEVTRPEPGQVDPMLLANPAAILGD